MKKKLLAAAMLLALAIPGASYAKTFKYSAGGTATHLDPVRSGTKYTNLVTTAVFDTLYEFKYLKRPFELKPSLAVALPEVSEDGLTYTIKIKEGVHFTDDAAFSGGKGREVVAEDFVYSLKRHFDADNRSSGSWLWQEKIKGLDAWGDAGADYSKEVSGLKALDKYTIQITLNAPFPQLTYTLTQGFTGIMAKEVVDHYGKEITVHPVGSGPFMVESFNTQRAILVRNPKYRGDVMDLEGYDEAIHGASGVKQLEGKTLPIVDRVEVNFITEASTAWNSFTKGDEVQNATLLLEQMNNVLTSKNPVTLNEEYAAKYNMKVEVEAGYVYNNFNMSDPTVGYHPDPEQNEMNKALRCALRKSFNWPERIKRFYYGIGEAFPGIIPPGVDGYDPNLSRDSVTYDPEGAKELLKEAGWTKRNLPVIGYHSTASTRSRQFYEQWKGFMKKIGYPTGKLKLKTYANFGDFNKATKQKKAPYFGMGWGLDYPDAENVLQLYYGPNGSPGSNSANFNDPEYNLLYEATAKMQPSPVRSEIYKIMNKILIDNCVTVSGFSRTRIRLWHKNAIMYPTESILHTYFKYIDVK